MKKVIILFFFLAIICSCSFLKKEQVLYSIFIGTNGTGFEDDSFASAGGKEIVGGIYIYINENPIAYYGGYGQVDQINQWLKGGKNTVDIKGNSSRDLYIKVISTNTKGENFKTIFKKHLSSGDIEYSGIFQTNVDFDLPLFENSFLGKDENIIKTEIKNVIMELKNNIENKNESNLIKQLLLGPSIWQPSAYYVDWKKNRNIFIKRIKTVYIEDTQKIIDFNVNDINMIFGKNVIYAYSGIDRDPPPGAYLFKVMQDSKVEHLPAIKLMKHKNKWIIWQ